MSPPLLVVLRALKLGDLLVAVPALRALARAFPDHRRVLCAPGWLEPLVHHLAVVDEVAHTGELEPLAPALAGADLAVNLHGRGPQSTALLAATGPRRLIAWDVPGCATWREEEHERHRWCRLLAEAGIPADPDDLQVTAPDVPPPAAAVGATVLHPGASTGSRRWPVDRWAAVAAAEVRAGRTVVLTGTAGERPLAEAVARQAGLHPACVLAGRTGLLELVALVAGAGRAACGDTGIAHVATAVGTPSVVLFGPSSPARWGPPRCDRHLVLWTGRTGAALAEDPDPGLLELTVEEVVGALDRLPAAPPAGRRP